MQEPRGGFPPGQMFDAEIVRRGVDQRANNSLWNRRLAFLVGLGAEDGVEIDGFVVQAEFSTAGPGGWAV